MKKHTISEEILMYERALGKAAAHKEKRCPLCNQPSNDQDRSHKTDRLEINNKKS